MYSYESIHEPRQFKYDVAEKVTENKIECFFISKGECNILKVISYSLLEELHGRKLFNFGFGDYNLADGTIVDNVISNNGDAYRVFNTVLSTVPRFFEIHNDAIMSVKGSDSSPEFAEVCSAACRRRCADICRNANRRINIYKAYVNKHYDVLIKNYAIYGGVAIIDNTFSMIDYEPNTKQESIVLMKNKNERHMQIEKNQIQEVMEPTSDEEMIARYLEMREKSNWADLFARQNAEAREWLKALHLKDQQRNRID
jgi:hypothetical protein